MIFRKKTAVTNQVSDNIDQYGKDNTPFFILGCVRSGTTMLRDVLRMHPRLDCPEETHFFRWSDPYASPRYERNYNGTKLFKEHRKLDGISDWEFHEIKRLARDKKEISDMYGRLYLIANNNPEGRWFDKTPQNIYGGLLLNYYYPDSKYVHIYRSPLNVVSSLKEGKVMAKHTVKGGINYWMESMIMMHEFKKLVVERVCEVKYETLVESPREHLVKIFEFLGEDPGLFDYSKVSTHKEKNKYKKILTEDEIYYVKKLTEPFASQYGYGSE